MKDIDELYKDFSRNVMKSIAKEMKKLVADEDVSAGDYIRACVKSVTYCFVKVFSSVHRDLCVDLQMELLECIIKDLRSGTLDSINEMKISSGENNE